MPRVRQSEGIRIDVLGDSGPFSASGKSVGYRISRKGISYLIDTGAAVFREIGKEGILAIRGVFGTHSHEDHKRWFSDIALFRTYSPDSPGRLRLITSELIHEEYHKNSKGTMERSLSDDSKRLVDIPYDDFVEKVLIGPTSRYRIAYRDQVKSAKEPCVVVDSQNRRVPAAMAKVVINPRANRPRMLFRDPTSGEWVEPLSYYAFDDRTFYEEEQNPYVDEDAGLTFGALLAPAWHGPPTISIVVSTENERVFFSSDTVYDPDLWHELCEERRQQRLAMSRKEFEEAYIIYDDINNYIERTWSRRRFERALAAYQDSVVIHDAAGKKSIVHTDYEKIAAAGLPEVMLTHTPDRFVSAIPVAKAGATYSVVNGKLYEEVGGTLRYQEADYYVKRYPRYYVGFRCANGPFKVVEKDGVLDVLPWDANTSCHVVARVGLYEAIGGCYYPLEDGEGTEHRVRPDGKVERVVYSARGSTGIVVKDVRTELERRRRRTCSQARVPGVRKGEGSRPRDEKKASV